MSESKSVSKSKLNPEDDAPELTDEWFASADLYYAGKLKCLWRIGSVGCG